MVHKQFLGGALVLGVVLLLFFIHIPVADSLVVFLQEGGIVGMLFFVALMFIATVIAPLAVLPLVPIAAPLFGPFLTAVLAITGWWFGAVVAFLIARHGGRPLLTKYLSFEKIQQYESKIPAHVTFGSLVLLRMVIPVDILSYALGVFSSIGFVPYSLATLIGITPFAFIFSYAGSAFISVDIIQIVGLALLALVLWGTILTIVKR